MSTSIIEVRQGAEQKIYETKYTVDWLVNHTRVKYFDPVTFTGYQRQLDGAHVDNIIKYVCEKGLFFPSSIICSSDEEYSENIDYLYIVDGQHRVEAFKVLEKRDEGLYRSIKDYEIPVIVLDRPNIKAEINTFIDINKTAKKVDTSLAYVLKNMKNRDNNDDTDIDIPRREYIAVEAAIKLNENPESPLWYDRILYEGSIRNAHQYISLNYFVRAIRSYLSLLDTKGIINLNWSNKEDSEKIAFDVAEIIEHTWNTIYIRYPELYKNSDDRRIIQGAIGFVTINRYLYVKLKASNGINSIESYKDFIHNVILFDMNGCYDNWVKGGKYSAYSSETGYKVILKDMLGE